MLRLHVNVDHVATLRQARRASFPDPVEWALQAESAGVDGITCHLRKDRRHVQDADLPRMRERLRTRLNLECSLDEEMLAIAEASGSDCFCLVPEQRAEVTTEGGLDVLADGARIERAVERLSRKGAAVSLFVDPDLGQLEAAAATGAPFVELHTGAYANASGGERRAELERLARAAAHARGLGLRVNAGHGLDYDNVGPVAAIAGLEELNIGFAIVSRSLFVGVEPAIRGMIAAVEAACRGGR
jgi:pyridoxine 5-phosphate synthase